MSTERDDVAIFYNMKNVFYGTIASFSLLAFYTLIMTILSKSFLAAWEQFQSLWWIMLPLAMGFGIQVGLYTKLKQSGSTVAAGGISGGIGMVACCSHHLIDVLPLIGLAGVSIFLSQYQIPILVGSLFINLLGIVLMLKHLHKSSVILGSPLKADDSRIRFWTSQNDEKSVSNTFYG